MISGPMYFEDVPLGHTEVSDEVVADRNDMVDYAVRHDPFPIHTEDLAAESSQFGGLVASFGYTVSLYLSRLHDLDLVRATEQAFLGALSWNVNFAKAVRPEDRLRVRSTVVDKRLTSSGDRGVVTSSAEILDQHGDPVVTIEVRWMIATRPPDEGPG